MKFPIIKVSDKHRNGRTHIVGTDTHDTLHISKNGGIHYMNLQNSETTFGDYEFVGDEHEHSPYPEIEFVTFKGLRKLHKAQIKYERKRKKLKDKVQKTIARSEKRRNKKIGGDK